MRFVALITLAIVLAASADVGLYLFAQRERPRPVAGLCLPYVPSESEKLETRNRRNALCLVWILVNAGAIAFIRTTLARARQARERRFLDANPVFRRRTLTLPLLGMTLAGLVSVAAWLGFSGRWSQAANRELDVATLELVRPDLPFVWMKRIRASNEREPAKRESLDPAIAPTPPYPKALVEDEFCDLGPVPSGVPRCHHVCIKNVGDAPLILSKLRWHYELPVGEALDYQIDFRVPQTTGVFAQADVLRTNDPERQEIRIAIVGLSE
jgi:hypothetical protein